MNKQIIFNLAVKDLAKSRAFFAAFGFGFDPQFSGENTAFMNIVDGSIHAMLMTETMFRSLIAKAVAARGRTPHPPEDHGFMVDQGFEDIDGHLWNLVWMAPQN